MSESIAGGQAVDLPIKTGESLKIGYLGGTYSATAIAGRPGLPEALATNATTSQTLGPWTQNIVVRLSTSANGRVEYAAGKPPVFAPSGQRFVRTSDGVPVELKGQGASAEYLAAGSSPTAPASLAASGSYSTSLTEGTRYESAAPTVTGGVPPYAFGPSGGALPYGMRVDAETGVLRGVPSFQGSFGGVKVRATDQLGNFIDMTVGAITVAAPSGGGGVLYSRVGILGDSITLRYWSAWNPVTVTSSGGVATVTHAIPTTQQVMPGQKIKMYAPGENRPIMGEFTILARTSGTTFTYAYSGTDDATNFSCSLGITNGYTDQSYFNYLQGICAQRLNLVVNGGVGGETSTQILARADAFLAAQPLDLIILNCGANDLVQGVASATINANWQQLIQKCAAAAMKVVVITTAPIQAQGGATAKIVHDYVVAQAALYQNVAVADAFTICADPASGSSYTPKANYLLDGVHWGQRMALEVAQAIKPLIEAQLPAAVGPQGANLLTNGDFTGTPVSGVAPNWTVTATGMPTSTRTVESSADGNLQQVVCVTNAAQTCLIEADTEHTKVTAGKRYRVWMRVKGAGMTAMNTVGGGLNMTAGGIVHTMRFMMANADGTTQTPFVDFDLDMRTETFLCPASVTSLRVRCAFVWTGTGGGTVAIGKAFLEEMP